MKLLVTVTFNENQLASHLEPLTQLSYVSSVLLVADAEVPTNDKVETIVPPRWLRLAIGRAASKAITCLWFTLRCKPAWIVGFNLVPHGFTAITVGRLTNTPSMYHMIGGPAEWIGGGWQSGNAILGRLPRPVRSLERLLVNIIRCATLTVTLGPDARDQLRSRGIANDRVTVIPPAIDIDRFRPTRRHVNASYDLLVIASLLPVKRLDRFLRIACELSECEPSVRAAIVGSGPLKNELSRLISELGLKGVVDLYPHTRDVGRYYGDARLFVMTSDHEGRSIALGEALASGLPAVVTDVGDQDQQVLHGVNGYLAPANDVAQFVKYVRRLLSDETLYDEFSHNARKHIRSCASIEVVAQMYDSRLTR